jgi:hypothetical protein
MPDKRVRKKAEPKKREVFLRKSILVIAYPASLDSKFEKTLKISLNNLKISSKIIGKRAKNFDIKTINIKLLIIMSLLKWTEGVLLSKLINI